MLMIIGIATPVKAANYTMKELIPERTKTTIRGETFLYKDLSYNEGIISFGLIKNNSKEKAKLSISVGLFDQNKKNIGTVNYCSESVAVAPKEEKEDYVIDVSSSQLATGKSYKNIKYISVLGENITCRTDGAQDYIGETVEQIGMAKNTSVGDNTMLLVRILEVISAIIIILFLYKFFLRYFYLFPRCIYLLLLYKCQLAGYE